ncbi:hypothetical protein GGR51DRAFT_538522 [Nemania sp. FL0031]|nr:hypothetical protein GGR51DRAFT_538522 [Nemania sp. FL0031]
MDSNQSSPTRTESTSTLVFTPATSISSSSTANSTQALPQPPIMLSGPRHVTALNVSSWRTPYPRIGQFAISSSEQVVAAGPSGLFCFRRVRDHDSKPWSEPRPLPNTSALLNDSSVSGIAVHVSRESDKTHLHVYCVSLGVLHSFYRSGDDGSPFTVNPRPPLSSHRVSGTPAVTAHPKDGYRASQRWSLVVPCQSGGLLHTSSATHPSTNGRTYSSQNEWDKVDHVAKDLGIISAVSITTTQTKAEYNNPSAKIVAVCVARARLHTLEGDFGTESSRSSALCWKAQASTRIPHPGEVTGNPVLIKKGEIKPQLDLLVPSAEGGVFHFVRTPSNPDEWHMIARITFPQGLPMASCLAVINGPASWGDRRNFIALIQSGGQLYQAKTPESATPWIGSTFRPISVPGPFFD